MGPLSTTSYFWLIWRFIFVIRSRHNHARSKSLTARMTTSPGMFYVDTFVHIGLHKIKFSLVKCKSKLFRPNCLSLHTLLAFVMSTNPLGSTIKISSYNFPFKYAVAASIVCQNRQNQMNWWISHNSWEYFLKIYAIPLDAPYCNNIFIENPFWFYWVTAFRQNDKIQVAICIKDSYSTCNFLIVRFSALECVFNG